jgi:hypothetical protein
MKIQGLQQPLPCNSGCESSEAMARGLSVHQMIGILPDKARQIYQMPDAWKAWTGLAIGYQGDPMSLPDNLKERDLTPRQRKPMSQFVFAGKWGNASELVQNGARARSCSSTMLRRRYSCSSFL